MSNSEKDAVYVLITQCLQNDFFLNRECKLRLPPFEAKKMLVGGKGLDLEEKAGDNYLKFGLGYPAKGPLGLFLKSVIKDRLDGKNGSRGLLYVINIRDCHEPSKSYDQERYKYGPHCEDPRGQDYIEGLTEYLDPSRKKAGHGPRPSKEERFKDFEGDTVKIYHINSNSVFDFRSSGQNSGFAPGKLSNILEDITSVPERKLYVAVIGVYTDIKVKIILTMLRGMYNIPNLAVSDTLTASPSLERHLGALDFAKKVLNVEVIHGLNDLITFLGGGTTVEEELDIVEAERFSDYESFFQDKQNVLGYGDKKLQEYLHITQKRSNDVYRIIKLVNYSLFGFGIIFLLLTLAGAITSAFWPKLNWKLTLVTGGLSVFQLVSTFFWRPMEYLQKNLNNIATFRMILESHSLKTALARFHLTTPQTLHENMGAKLGIGDELKSGLAKEQVQVLMEELKAIEQIEEQNYRSLNALGFGIDKKDLENKDMPDTK